VRVLHLDGAQMGQGGALCFLCVLEQCSGGGDGSRFILNAETCQVTGAKLFGQQVVGSLAVKMPGGAFSQTTLAG